MREEMKAECYWAAKENVYTEEILMREEMKVVFELAAPECMPGQPVQIDGGWLCKDSNEQIYALLILSSVADQEISAVIVDFTGSDITGKQIEKHEHQYLDLSMSRGEQCGENILIQMLDIRVRKLSVVVKTVVFADGTMWNLKDRKKVATMQNVGRLKKPLLAVIALVLVTALVFGGIQLFGHNKKDAQVDNVLTFGHYPQAANGNDNTPIEWLVLDMQDNKALVISRYGLDAKPYNTEDMDVTWETCTLRTWLNGEFLNTAFSAAEQEAILTTTVDNSDAQCFDFTTVICVKKPNGAEKATGGNNTQDKVFLLSYAEANKYFNVQHYSIDGAIDNVKSRVEPTAYAIARGAYASSDYKTAYGKDSGGWWLRSPGRYQDDAADVDPNGFLDYCIVNGDGGVVRPALWINLESEIF